MQTEPAVAVLRALKLGDWGSVEKGKSAEEEVGEISGDK